VVRTKSVACVLLNSNFSRLTSEEQTRQITWYTQTLDSLEQDPTIAYVFVGCHHPPYSNNTLAAPSPEVRQTVVPPFLRHSKCVLFMSGHTHAFEHFQQQGKDFIVLGGGGGLQHAVLLGNKRRYVDLYPRDESKRMFHFIRCEVGTTSIRMSVMMIRNDFSGIDSAYSWTIRNKSINFR
jgi:hypothetical protein